MVGVQPAAHGWIHELDRHRSEAGAEDEVQAGRLGDGLIQSVVFHVCLSGSEPAARLNGRRAPTMFRPLRPQA